MTLQGAINSEEWQGRPTQCYSPRFVFRTCGSAPDEASGAPLIFYFAAFYSAILAMCTSKPVLGKSEVSENALNPSPLTSFWG